MVGRLPVLCHLDLKRSSSSLEELADVRFQAVVTPIGQEGIRLLFYFNYCYKAAIKRGNGGNVSLVSIVIKTRM